MFSIMRRYLEAGRVAFDGRRLGLVAGLLAAGLTGLSVQADDIVTSGTEHLVVAPGTYDNIIMNDQSSVNMGDGVDVLGYVKLRHQNIFRMTGGTVGDYVMIDHPDAIARIFGGSIGGTVVAFSYSEVHLHGGTLGDDLQIVNASTGYMSGGSVLGEVRVSEIATLYMSGGDLVGDVMLADDDAQIYIYADDFGPGYQAGDVITFEDLTIPFEDSAMGIHLDLTYVDQTQTSFDFIAGSIRPWTGTLYLIPEPGTAGLLALGVLGLMKRR